jgi:propionyl-CoA carboxylase beta chain
MIATPAVDATRTLHDLAYCLRGLHEVYTRSDYVTTARQRAKGKQTIPEKLALLFDAGTFVETSAAAPTMDPRHGERRLVTGHGLMNQRLVAVALFDSSIAGGAVTVSTGKKLIAHMQRAEDDRCPLFIDWDSGGADINDGIASLDVVRQIFTKIAEISGRIPTLSLISGLNAGCGAYAPVMTDTVIMIEGSMMAVTGPTVIKVATGEDVTPEQMGGADLHTRQSGEAHYRVSNYREAAHLVQRYFSYLPQSMWSLPPRRAPQETQGLHTALGAIIDQAQQNARLKRNASWDVRTFIAAAIDDDSWLEYHEHFAPSVVVGLARIAGIAVAMIANQRLVLGGALTAAASSKITRFLRLANAYHLPVITLVDVPGFIATQTESAGQILSKGAGLLMMYPNLAVPRISVVIDKAFGGAYCAMDSIASSVRFRRCRHYGFTTGQIAVMGKEAGPFFTYGPDGSDPTLKEQHQQRYDREYLNMNLAYKDGFVGPLRPEELRLRLVEEVTRLYTEYDVYWQALKQELEVAQLHCPHLYRELRYGAVRGYVQPL